MKLPSSLFDFSSPKVIVLYVTYYPCYWYEKTTMGKIINYMIQFQYISLNFFYTHDNSTIYRIQDRKLN